MKILTNKLYQYYTIKMVVKTHRHTHIHTHTQSYTCAFHLAASATAQHKRL